MIDFTYLWKCLAFLRLSVWMAAPEWLIMVSSLRRESWQQCTVTVGGHLTGLIRIMKYDSWFQEGCCLVSNVWIKFYFLNFEFRIVIRFGVVFTLTFHRHLLVGWMAEIQQKALMCCLFLIAIIESKLGKACGNVSMDIGYSPYTIGLSITLLLIEAVATKLDSNLVNASGLLFRKIEVGTLLHSLPFPMVVMCQKISFPTNNWEKNLFMTYLSYLEGLFFNCLGNIN